MRLSLALLLSLVVLVGPTASAQAPTTSIKLVATPAGGWNADGFLDADRESAQWKVNATVTFSNTGFCAEPTNLVLDLIDLAQKTTDRSVQPATTPIDAPAGGGSTSVNATASFKLPATARGGDPLTVRLHAFVEECPSPIGTTPKAEANATLDVRALLKPTLQVDYENRSAAGIFNFSVANTGNGPLVVGAVVAPVDDAPEQSSDPPVDLGLDPDEFTTFTLTFPEHKPGRYDVTIIGRYNGADAAKQPRGEFTAHIEIPQPILVRETKKAPGFDVVALGLVGAAVVGWRKRARA